MFIFLPLIFHSAYTKMLSNITRYFCSFFIVYYYELFTNTSKKILNSLFLNSLFWLLVWWNGEIIINAPIVLCKLNDTNIKFEIQGSNCAIDNNQVSQAFLWTKNTIHRKRKREILGLCGRTNFVSCSNSIWILCFDYEYRTTLIQCEVFAGDSVMKCGCQGKISLLFISTKNKSLEYRGPIWTRLLDKCAGSDWKLQHDNTSIHVAKETESIWLEIGPQNHQI